jgi:hypothetical protein
VSAGEGEGAAREEEETRGYVHGQEDEEEDVLSRTCSTGRARTPPRARARTFESRLAGPWLERPETIRPWVGTFARRGPTGGRSGGTEPRPGATLACLARTGPRSGTTVATSAGRRASVCGHRGHICPETSLGCPERRLGMRTPRVRLPGDEPRYGPTVGTSGVRCASVRGYPWHVCRETRSVPRGSSLRSVGDEARSEREMPITPAERAAFPGDAARDCSLPSDGPGLSLHRPAADVLRSPADAARFRRYEARCYSMVPDTVRVLLIRNVPLVPEAPYP